MKNKKLLFCCFLAAAMLLSTTGCKEVPKPEATAVQSEAAEAEVQPTATANRTLDTSAVTESEEPKEEADKKPEAYTSRLTGLEIDQSKLSRRPVAVMVSNIKEATPQSGLSYASVIYEAPVEGYITRFMAVYDDWDNVPRIGSVRSARTYFVRYMTQFDAFCIHVGEAYNDRRLLNKNNSITESGDGTIFRDKSRRAPHNAFTSGEKLNAFFTKNSSKLRVSLSENEQAKTMFLFNETDTEPAAAENVTAAGSIDLSGLYNYNKPSFSYDGTSKTYKRKQFGVEAKDALNGSALEFKNVIIEFTSGRVFDKKGRWDINETGGGDGYYFTNGKAIKIKWAFKDGRTRYYDSISNEEIRLNRGKTWVCIAINDRKAKLKIG